MSATTVVSCPACGPRSQTVAVETEWHHGEMFARACATCLARFTYDGVTFDFVRVLPPPVLRDEVVASA